MVIYKYISFIHFNIILFNYKIYISMIKIKTTSVVSKKRDKNI